MSEKLLWWKAYSSRTQGGRVARTALRFISENVYITKTLANGTFKVILSFCLNYFCVFSIWAGPSEKGGLWLFWRNRSKRRRWHNIWRHTWECPTRGSDVSAKCRYIYFLTILTQEQKDEIWLSPMTKALISTENSEMQRDYTKTPPKLSTSQRLRTDFKRSVIVTTATPLVWFNRFTSAQPSN